jgi:prevent-host-death family protein
MSTVTAYEAKTRFGKLLARVAHGEEVVITRHEKPVARMVPEGLASLASAREAVAGLRQLQKRIAAREKGMPSITRAEFKSAVHWHCG